MLAFGISMSFISVLFNDFLICQTYVLVVVGDCSSEHGAWYWPGIQKYAEKNLLNWYTAFEMWRHTRRNQISSFGETDESI